MAYQRSNSISEFLWDDFQEGSEMSMGRLQWVQVFCEKHQIHKYIIVVCILPHCQVRHILVTLSTLRGQEFA